MALRLVEVYLPEGYDGLERLRPELHVVEQWEAHLEGGQHLVRMLVDAEETEHYLDLFEREFGGLEAYRIVLLPVEAVLPRIEKEEPDEAVSSDESRVGRVSREELYQDVNESISVTRVFHTLVVLSTIVAAGGMIGDNVAVVVGAMVIAPLIGPNIALALATTLGDTDLFQRALRVNLLGLLIALLLSVAVGMAVDVDPTIGEIASRTNATLADMALALAAGVAGALSFTRGVSSALIGVMVAVALLPPLVAFGMLLGSGYHALAYRAALLLVTNIACVNFAGVVTFLVQGIRPARWYEAEQAKKSTRIALLLWAGVLAVLIVVILLAQEGADA